MRNSTVKIATLRNAPVSRIHGHLRPAWLSLLLPAALLTTVLLFGASAGAQTESLLDRISNERMRAFEENLTTNINNALARYISHGQYVLSVKVIWNRDIIPAVQTPGLAPDKQKLPGFPIFVKSPGAVGDQGAPPFVRMVVKVLIDETLPEYYERFLRKIVPVVARFDAARGDQVIVLKETFPVKQKDEPPLTLPEKELMEQLGPEARGRPAPEIPAGIDPMEAAQLAYEEGRYNDALGIVQSAFQRATSNKERAEFLGMEGSVFYTVNKKEGAMASWKRALTFDPTNLEVQRVVRFFESKAPAEVK